MEGILFPRLSCSLDASEIIYQIFVMIYDNIKEIICGNSVTYTYVCTYIPRDFETVHVITVAYAFTHQSSSLESTAKCYPQQ